MNAFHQLHGLFGSPRPLLHFDGNFQFIAEINARNSDSDNESVLNEEYPATKQSRIVKATRVPMKLMNSSGLDSGICHNTAHYTIYNSAIINVGSEVDSPFTSFRNYDNYTLSFNPNIKEFEKIPEIKHRIKTVAGWRGACLSQAS